MRHPPGLRAVGTVLLALLATAAVAAKGPLIRLSERTIDFGVVDQHKELHHEIRLQNAGDAPLRILKLEVDCGCTMAIPTDSLVLPGREVSLDVSLSTKDMKGPQEKRLTLHTNDPAEPRLFLIIRADVRPPIQASEDLVRFGEVRRGSTVGKKIVLTTDQAEALVISSITGGGETVRATVETKKGSDPRTVDLLIAIRADAPAGEFREVVIVQASKPPQTKVEIQVQGTVISYFVAENKGRLLIPPGPKGRRAEATLAITCDGSKPYRLGRVETGLPYLLGEIVPAGKAAHALRLTLTESAPVGPFRQKVRIETTDPDQPFLEILAQGNVRE